LVRDTGCLRQIQTMYAPAPYNGANATPWVGSTAVTANSVVFSNIFTYQYQTNGVSGTTAPAYPSGTSNYPPSTAFADGTATLLYVQDVEKIPFSQMPQGLNTIDILNVNLYWGNTRVPMRYMPWTQFNAELRFWQNYIGRPICFSVYNQNTLYLAPVPDQVYQLELDTIVQPTNLVNSTDTDNILIPWSNPIQFYAAYQAKFYEQSFGESELFKQQYISQVQSVLAGTNTRRMPNPYSTIY
jgi:hypothetical protein